MADRHYGEIGNLWKHLPLAEILNIQKPKEYWETHSGSAQYPLTHSPTRDYGIYYFLEHAEDSTSLSMSTYLKILKSLGKGGELKTYPGSPYIAMTLLKEGTSFLFCDLDEASLRSIETLAKKFKTPARKIRTVHGDGVPIVADAAAKIPAADLSNVVVFIDPYRPFVESDNGVNAIQLFADLTQKGIKTVLWYGYDSHEYRDTILSAIRLPFINRDEEVLMVPHIWCGDINLVAMEDATFTDVPGVLGYGVACGNLSNLAMAACDKLGQELAGIYETAEFPDGHTGALNYQSIPLL